MAHTPTRRCRVCRTPHPKSEMLRWTVIDGQPAPDPAQTAPGRGYYSCSERCQEILPKTIKTVNKKS